MFYTVYKITNRVNGKIYIGVHKTEDLNDDYMGSGKLIKRAIAKHGIENFEREYLAVFDNPEDMFNMESEIVNEDFVSDNSTYNLKLGGEGGFPNKIINSDSARQRAKCIKGIEKQKWLTENNPDWDGRKKQAEAGRRTLQKLHAEGRCRHDGFSGKSHTDEAKRKIGKANSIQQKGTNNSVYGTRWIHSLVLKQSKRIKKDESLPYGWIEGRKIKF